MKIVAVDPAAEVTLVVVADLVADAVLVDQADVDPVAVADKAAVVVLVGQADEARAENAAVDVHDVTKKTQVSSNAL
jgi:hypothetical protein